MVTFGHRTDFYCRYQDGKREMTYGEIKDAFAGDEVRKQVSTVGSTISDLQSDVITLGGESTDMATLFWKMSWYFLRGVKPGEISSVVQRIFQKADTDDCHEAEQKLMFSFRSSQLIRDEQKWHLTKGYTEITTTSLGASVIKELRKQWGDSPWPP